MANDSFDGQRVTAATFLVRGRRRRDRSVHGGQRARGRASSVEEIEEGGENSFVHKLPGRMTWPNIVLKRGDHPERRLLHLAQQVVGRAVRGQRQQADRSTAAITLIGPAGQRLRSWDFVGAFPVKWKGPTFDAASTDMALEELEITHHGFRAKSLT